jgi:hypothetical protein
MEIPNVGEVSKFYYSRIWGNRNMNISISSTKIKTTLPENYSHHLVGSPCRSCRAERWMSAPGVRRCRAFCLSAGSFQFYGHWDGKRDHQNVSDCLSSRAAQAVWYVVRGIHFAGDSAFIVRVFVRGAWQLCSMICLISAWPIELAIREWFCSYAPGLGGGGIWQ